MYDEADREKHGCGNRMAAIHVRHAGEPTRCLRCFLPIITWQPELMRNRARRAGRGAETGSMWCWHSPDAAETGFG